MPGPGPGPGPAAQRPQTQKPGLNVYTMMLILSFIFLVIANVLMYLEYTRYGTNPADISGARPQGVSFISSDGVDLFGERG